MTEQLPIAHPLDQVMPVAFKVSGKDINPRAWDLFQAHLGQHMASHARGERAGRVPMDKTGVSDEARARLAATVDKVMAIMADGQPRNCPSIMHLSGAKDHEIRAALIELRARGKLSVVGGSRVGQQTVYQHRGQA